MEIMGRGPLQIIQETPQYYQLLKKYLGYKIFNKRSPIFGSVDIINVCNLHCTHCYWWLNRKEDTELTVKDWKKIIDEKFKKQHIFVITLVGGEPMMRPDIVELFVKEFPKRVCVVTNGTYPIPHYPETYFYWVSVDGNQPVHNKIRGEDAWNRTRKNVLDYVEKNGEKAWKDIWISMTVNSQNYHTIRDVIEDWHDYSNKIGFQFHTPFMKGDPLWLPFGDVRNKVIDEILYLQKEYKDYIVNPPKNLELMRKSWGGRGTTPIDCPTWGILSLDHRGREKHPCCIGSAEKESLKPICEDCGLGCYSILLNSGLRG
ncbi:radical SAM protein [Candidatus Nitrosotenuis sp. DW1]|nr:radical SAM protein [Candidatus Nitrosotenuis sp. DW1]